VSVEELTRVLWKERELVDMLVFKLDVERLLLTSGQRRWIAYAAHEAGVVVDTVRQTEVLRATAADAVAAAHGREPGASLRDLAEATPEPWATILLDHRRALEASTTEVAGLARANRETLASEGFSRPSRRRPAHRGSLALVADGTERGLLPPDLPDGGVEDVVLQAALAATTASTLPNSLSEFLR
jgi:hypothetical protein